MVKHDLLNLCQDLGVDMCVHQRWSLNLLLRQVQTRNARWPHCARIYALLVHHIVGKKVPKIEADLKKLIVSNSAHLGQVGQALQRLITEHLNLIVGLDAACDSLNKIEVIAKDRANG